MRICIQNQQITTKPINTLKENPQDTRKIITKPFPIHRQIRPCRSDKRNNGIKRNCQLKDESSKTVTQLVDRTVKTVKYLTGPTNKKSDLTP